MEISVTFLPVVNSIIIKGKDKAFLTTKDAVIFDRDIFIQILFAMLKEGYISPKIIEGVLEDINTC